MRRVLIRSVIFKSRKLDSFSEIREESENVKKILNRKKCCLENNVWKLYDTKARMEEKFEPPDNEKVENFPRRVKGHRLYLYPVRQITAG